MSNEGRMLRQRPCNLRLLCVQAHSPTAHVTKSWADLLAGPRDHGIGSPTLGQSESSTDAIRETLPEATLLGAALRKRRNPARKR